MAQGRELPVAQTVRELVEPIAQELGVRVWDVRFVKEGADWYLRVFIDKDGGVNVDDCEAVSRAADAGLDSLDPVPGGYIFEVSSPGLERELVRDEHFAQFIGADIKVRLIRPLPQIGREFCGVLTESDRDTVKVTDHSGENTVTINKKDAAWIKLDDFG